MRAICNAIFFALALIITVTPAYAGFLVTVDSLTLSAGDSGTLDVYIESDGVNDNPPTTFNLAAFSAEFGITPLGGSGPLLQFSSVQPDPSSASYYVFSGDSGGYTSAGTLNGTALVGDLTSSGSDVTVGAKRLLTELTVTASPATPATNATFSIDLIPASGTSDDFLSGNANTGFLARQGSPISFSSDSGMVTITGASAVPEPGTFGMLLIGMIGLTAASRNARRQSC